MVYKLHGFPLHVYYAGLINTRIKMENFLKPFLEKGLVHSIQKLDENSVESDIIKFFQRIIFKHDILIEFKEILQSTCSSKPFTVKSDIVKNLIVQLNELLLLDINCKAKSDVFRYLFLSFASSSIGDGVSVLQFFIVLCHILGIESPQVKSDGFPDIINSENFNNAFGVKTSKASTESFLILKDLLLAFSKLPISLSLSEVQAYNKWLQNVLKNFAQPNNFQIIFLEIFTICADIDLRLVEGNLEEIFSTTLSQQVDGYFSKCYNEFLTEVFKIFAKFQRTVKFLTKFLSSVKSSVIVLPKEVILPLDFLRQFSEAVKMTSTHQSVLLMEVLVQNLEDSCSGIAQNKSGFETVLFVTSKLLTEFLKEVKLIAPSISSTSLGMLTDKLNALKKVLKGFGEFLFSDIDFIRKNDSPTAYFLEVCFYCDEIEMLINCYKDSMTQTEEVSDSSYDWQFCLNVDQWISLTEIVRTSKLQLCSLACFQMALQRLRSLKLQMRESFTEDSAVKVILSLVKSDSSKLCLITPEDLTILIECLTAKQIRSVVKKLLKEILSTPEEVAVMSWLSNPVLQENSTFIVTLLSELLKESGSLLSKSVGSKHSEKFSWLSDDYFDDENNIRAESLLELPEKLNALLGSSRKVRKSLNDSGSMGRVLRVFRGLPLIYMGEELRKLGLSYAVGVAVALSDVISLEAVHGFVNSDTDASTCFDVGLAIKWLSELSFDEREAADLRLKTVEALVWNSRNSKFGLKQMGGVIDGETAFKIKGRTSLGVLETQVTLHQELGKCWQRAKKRQADNDFIASYRKKLAKMISEEVKELDVESVDVHNSKLLFKIFSIELNKALKMPEDQRNAEVSDLMERKFMPYFNFAVKQLKTGFDEASASFLTWVLGLLPQLRKFVPRNTFSEIWEALKIYEKGNWQFFCTYSEDEEFKMVLDDLLLVFHEFLNPESKNSANCLEMWASFFEASSGSKANECQARLQEMFDRINDCSLLLLDLPIRRKIFLLRFFYFCLSSKKVILSPRMLDTIVHAMIECLNNSPSCVKDFHELFVAEVEIASGFLLKEFDWTKNKIHLTFVLFKRLLNALTTRCDAGRQLTTDEVLLLSTCGLSMEKWTSRMCTKEKDFARTTAYFVTAVISSIASVTVLPAIKIHLINSINNFLSISDSHTVAYLLRILKPGYQQVFNSIYTQFKKYHKYTGKI